MLLILLTIGLTLLCCSCVKTDNNIENYANDKEKYQDKLEVELDFFKQLKRIVDDYTKGKDVSIKMVMLREFANDLNAIINLYSVPVFTVFGKDKEKSRFKFDIKKDKEEKESTNPVEYSNLETEIIFDTETMFDDLQDD